MAYQSINPYTNEVIRTYDNISDEELENSLTRAHALYHSWRSDPASYDRRKKQLRQLARELRQHKEKYAEIMARELAELGFYTFVNEHLVYLPEA